MKVVMALLSAIGLAPAQAPVKHMTAEQKEAELEKYIQKNYKAYDGTTFANEAERKHWIMNHVHPLAVAAMRADNSDNSWEWGCIRTQDGQLNTGRYKAGKRHGADVLLFEIPKINLEGAVSWIGFFIYTNQIQEEFKLSKKEVFSSAVPYENFPWMKP